VYGIVRQSGGHICVYSELGHGTTFKLYFPIVTKPDVKQDGDDTGRRKLRGHETILLVEDDPSVRNLARSVLEMYGYTVLEAPEPSAAIRISQEHRGMIDILLTDVVMPHMNGKRLSELLAPDRPEMKVLFMSGYTDDAIVRQGVLDAGVNFIQKPFVPATLTAKVRDVLEGIGA
jgi:DNA-binding response OmpR family regulator